MSKTFFLLLLLCPFFTRAQITTIAGNGINGYTGDGGQATAAQLKSPFDDIAVDGSGNCYIVDYLDCRIRKVNATTGIITTAVSIGCDTGGAAPIGDGGAASLANLFNPTGVVLDGSGNMFIADGRNYRVRKVNAAGIINTYAGGGSFVDGVAATASSVYPWGLAVDGVGNLYISDANNRIRVVNASTGIIATIAGGTSGFGGDGGEATAAKLNDPEGMAVDGSGNLYIADAGNNRIRKVDITGTITTYAGNGSVGYSGDGASATNAELNGPSGIVVDVFGNLYIADENNNVIRKVNHAGIISTIAGTYIPGFSGDGGPAVLAQLNAPYAVALDGGNNLYISDVGNSRVRKIANVVSEVSNVQEKSSFMIYPNPAQNKLTIGSSIKINSISIMNLLGLTVYSHDYSTGKVDVDIANLPSGMYLVKINGTEVRKFMKE